MIVSLGHAERRSLAPAHVAIFLHLRTSFPRLLFAKDSKFRSVLAEGVAAGVGVDKKTTTGEGVKSPAGQRNRIRKPNPAFEVDTDLYQSGDLKYLLKNLSRMYQTIDQDQ